MTQRTLVLLKPDAVRRSLVGEIISRIERKADWRITALELRTLDRATLEQHYAEHVGRPFYEPLIEFMSSGPVVAMIVEGERVVEGRAACQGPEVDGSTYLVDLAGPVRTGDLVAATVVRTEGVDLVASAGGAPG
jgi:nucleoside diphosphate kinase